MGFFDFLFEDNHRRPPRKKKTNINGKNNATKTAVTTTESKEKNIQKIQASKFKMSEKDIRLKNFKTRPISRQGEKNSTTETFQSTSSDNPLQDKRADTFIQKENPIHDSEWILQRKKLLEISANNLIDSIKNKLGEGYVGLYAFDLDSDVFYTEQINPAPLFAVYLKRAFLSMADNPLGKPLTALIKTEKYLIYSFFHNGFVFNIFADKNSVSEGIIFHILRPLH